jgi:phosphatidylethanolamine-binding protein (PEBP) family uncharacterized protein
MPRSLRARVCLPLLCTFILAGCGSTESQRVIPSVVFKSPAIGTSIPAEYTCDGKDIAPPLEWGAVPGRSSELVVLLVGYAKIPFSSRFRVEGVDWALAGISPRLHRLAAGQLPAGTFIGLGGNHKPQPYSLCPARGSRKYYQFEIFALPASVRVPQEFGNEGAFRVFNATKVSPALAHGVFTASYERSSKH